VANVNRVFLLGRLTREPELRFTNSQTPVVELGMALHRQWTTSDGQHREETTFVEVVLWDRRAEAAVSHLHKGSSLFVEGRLELHEWVDDRNQPRKILRVVGDNVQFLDPKPDSPGGARNV